MFKPLRILGSLSSWCCLIYKVLFAFRLFSRSPVILGSARLFVVVPCYLTTQRFVCQALFSSFFAAVRPRKRLIFNAFRSFRFAAPLSLSSLIILPHRHHLVKFFFSKFFAPHGLKPLDLKGLSKLPLRRRPHLSDQIILPHSVLSVKLYFLAFRLPSGPCRRSRQAACIEYHARRAMSTVFAEVFENILVCGAFLR